MTELNPSQSEKLYKLKTDKFYDDIENSNLGKIIFGAINKNLSNIEKFGSIFSSKKSMFSSFLRENGFCTGLIKKDNQVSQISDYVKTDLLTLIDDLFNKPEFKKAAKEFLTENPELCKKIYENAHLNKINEIKSASAIDIIDGIKTIRQNAIEAISADVIYSQKTPYEKQGLNFDNAIIKYNKIFSTNINVQINQEDLIKLDIKNIVLKSNNAQELYEKFFRSNDIDKNGIISVSEFSKAIESLQLQKLDIDKIKINIERTGDSIDITFNNNKYSAIHIPVKLEHNIKSKIIDF